MKRLELLIIILAIAIILVLGILIYILDNRTKNGDTHVIIGNSDSTTVENGITYKTYNAVSYQFISDENMCATYLNKYNDLLINSTEEAYKILSEQYKNKRFPTFNSFESYVKQNMDSLKNAKMESYERKNYDEYYEYTIKDNYGRTYIIKETGVMEYTIELDSYTLENQSFKEKYEKASEMDKGVMNLQKFFEMINMKDYESAYDLLDQTFRQNSFGTVNEFANYMENKFYRYNVISSGDYLNDIADLHTYRLFITDATGENTSKINFNAVMKLLDGTNFVMSFEV